MKTLVNQYTREEGAQARAGLTTTIEPWEDGLREQPRPGTLEWWYFDAHFNDGSALVVVFMTKPTAESAGPIAPFLQAQLTLPTGEIVSGAQHLPAEAFHASRDGCEVHIGPHWLRGDLHRYELSTQSPELNLHLTFTGTVPPSRTGTGKTLIDERDYLGWLVAIPRGTVEGTITVRGQTSSVHGEGYHDHNWGTLPFEDYLREWYWGRAYLGDYTIIFSLTHALPAYGNSALPEILLARGSQILLATGQGAQMRILRERQEQDAAVPELAEFTWDDGHNHVVLTLHLTNEYLMGAWELRHGLPQLPPVKVDNPEVSSAMTLSMCFDYLGIHLVGSKAEGKQSLLNWHFTDVNEQFLVQLENCALTYTANKHASDADAALTLTRADFDDLIFGETTLEQALKTGALKVSGKQAKVKELFGLFEEFPRLFNIVTP